MPLFLLRPRNRIERETAKHARNNLLSKKIAPETTADLEDRRTPELQAPNFGSELNFELTEPSVKAASQVRQRPQVRSHRRWALLLAGGGVWYFRQQSGAVQAGVIGPSTPSPAVSASRGDSANSKTAPSFRPSSGQGVQFPLRPRRQCAAAN